LIIFFSKLCATEGLELLCNQDGLSLSSRISYRSRLCWWHCSGVRNCDSEQLQLQLA